MALVAKTTVLPDAFVGQPYEASFVATGATVAAQVVASAGTVQTSKDALPAGLSYSADGRITGTPTAPATVVPYRQLNLSVKLSNGTDTIDNVQYTLNLNYPSANSAAAADAASNKELPVTVDLARKNLGV